MTAQELFRSRCAVPLGSALLTCAVSGCGETAEPGGFEGRPANAEPSASSATAMPERFGFGQIARHEEIEAWDIDVMPNGIGLPFGEGTVETGARVYAEHCASCHGQAGEGRTAAALVGTVPGGGPPFGPRYEEWRGDRDHVPYTIGNYWPYATTLFDYINRAMPSAVPGSLTANQVYALVAWLLAKNEIIGNDAVMNTETLPAVEMPARHIFVPDDRRGGQEVK